ncbi:MAG: pyridoxamine 5'-phosphate oxidase family protein, partial [Actinomycetes bacterium]
MTASGSAPEPGATELTRLRRLPKKSIGDRAVLYDILDASLIAHVGICDEAGQPFVLPVGYARSADNVLFHGSSGSRLFRALAAGARTCFTVTRHANQASLEDLRAFYSPVFWLHDYTFLRTPLNAYAARWNTPIFE